MYMVKQPTTASLPEIGRQFGGKHREMRNFEQQLEKLRSLAFSSSSPILTSEPPQSSRACSNRARDGDP